MTTVYKENKNIEGKRKKVEWIDTLKVFYLGCQDLVVRGYTQRWADKCRCCLWHEKVQKTAKAMASVEAGTITILRRIEE